VPDDEGLRGREKPASQLGNTGAADSSTGSVMLPQMKPGSY